MTVDQVLETYDDWGSEARDLMRCAENPTRWTINVVYPPLLPEQWVRGPVGILGDAAHSMVPFYGQGLNCGLEDVRVLHVLLREEGVDPGGLGVWESECWWSCEARSRFDNLRNVRINTTIFQICSLTFSTTSGSDSESELISMTSGSISPTPSQRSSMADIE